MIKLADKITESKKKLNDSTIRLLEYDGSSYISDVMSEIADGDTPIYWSDLMKWFNNPGTDDYINNAVREGLVDTKDFDIFEAMRAGAYEQIYESVSNELEAGLSLWALVYIQDELKIDELDEEKFNEIWFEDFTDRNRFDEIEDFIKETLEIKENDND